jgi:hypothetical protein
MNRVRIDGSGAPTTPVRHEHPYSLRLLPTPLTSQLSPNSPDESGESRMCDLPGQRFLSTNQSLDLSWFRPWLPGG